MKLAIGYSTKDQVELTKQTITPLLGFPHCFDLFWADGSITIEGQELPGKFSHRADRVTGGADAAIAWKLSRLLNHTKRYEYIGLLENDVLLDPDWLEPTLALFEKGKADGLTVGAVSPRSYVDRILIQRDGYAVMHNIGAGAIIFTREAAEIALQSFRTHWWPDNVKLFAQLAKIDLRTYACFHGNEQWITTDWGWEAQLARQGLASLALTPAKCQMIGQSPSLAEQGLELTTKSGRDADAGYEVNFKCYQDNLATIREFKATYELPRIIPRDGAGMLFFPHQLGLLNAKRSGDWKLKWNQGFGPFAYQAGPDGASLSAHVSGSCSFLCSGGIAGASVCITDTRSGFNFSPDLSADDGQPTAITVPGTPIPRTIIADFAEGAVFCGLECAEPQMIDTTFEFNWSQLPEPV